MKNHTSIALTKKYSPLSILIGVLLCLVILYLYLAFYTAYLFADAKNTENYVKELQGPLATLESTYIDATKGLDVLFAYNQGFLDGASKTEYITRQSRTARVDR